MTSPASLRRSMFAFFLLTLAASARDPKPSWPAPVKPPGNAPSIAVILLDDVGFGAAATFGGPIETPALDRLAATGLRYNRFHTTALCSPTRAALFTGRNHHQSGFGTVTEIANAHPGYNSVWPDTVASFPEILRRHGYATAAFGKWHNTPSWETGPTGPFDRWPTGKGFEFFYGFLGGEVSQWEPPLYRNTTPVDPPATPEQSYHLTTDLADEAIRWLHTRQSVASEKPYLLYFATGAAHAPLHVPAEWIRKYRGKFDQGWDRLREETFARQKQLGVIPPDAELTPRPAELPAWDSFTPDQQRLAARQAEVYAAFLAHTDHETGRLVDAIRSAPGGDNTAIFYLVGDNGGSPEGGLEGSQRNLVSFFFSQPDSLEDQLAHLDELGSPLWDNHFATAWSWAINTPFQWTKQIASHLGGIRNPLVVSWPARIQAAGELRTRFTHVNDIAPTLYEITGIPFPAEVAGVEQIPLEGKSFAATFEKPDASEPERTQYFELGGNRGIYHNGWFAAARHIVPWQPGSGKGDFENDRWELYDLTKDFSQARDLAAAEPEKLKELQNLFDAEARRNQVYPLISGLNINAALDPTRPAIPRGRNEFIYRPGTPRLPAAAVPQPILSHRITAEIVIPETGADGVILAHGGRQGGYSLYLKDGKAVYEHNYFGKSTAVLTSSIPVPPDEVTLVYEFTKTHPSLFGGGSGKLSINAQPAGEIKIPNAGIALDPFEVGRKTGSPTGDGYTTPNRFTGEIRQIKIQLTGPLAALRNLTR